MSVRGSDGFSVKGDYSSASSITESPKATPNEPVKAAGTAAIAEANKTPEKPAVLSAGRTSFFGLSNAANPGFTIISIIISIVAKILTSITSSKAEAETKTAAPKPKEDPFVKELKSLKETPAAQIVEANLKSDPKLTTITGSDGKKIQIRKEMLKDFERTFSSKAIVVEVSTPEGPKTCCFNPPKDKSPEALADAIIGFRDAIVDLMPEKTKAGLGANKSDEINTWFNNVTFLQTQVSWLHESSVVMYEQYLKGNRAGEFFSKDYDTRHCHITIGTDRIHLRSTNMFEARPLGAAGNDKIAGYIVKNLNQSISFSGVCNPNPVTLADARYYGDKIIMLKDQKKAVEEFNRRI